MVEEKSKSRLSTLIEKACRLPKDVAGKVSTLSDSVSRERLKIILPTAHFPYKYTSLAILLLLYLPWMISLTYLVPPQVEPTLGSVASTEPFCNIATSPDDSVNHSLLLNTTPFSLTDDWELEWYSGLVEYDINQYGRNESDGVFFTCGSGSSDYSTIMLTHTMYSPLFNYSQITLSAEFEGVSGTSGAYIEAFADESWAKSEATFEPGNVTTVNVTAPLSEAKLISGSWLSIILFRVQIALSEGSSVKLRGVVIDAEFTRELSSVTIDMKDTENNSLFEDSFLHLNYYSDYSPEMILVQNNMSSLAGVYRPQRVDDVLYLPPGEYEGEVYWRLYYQEPPDPTNSSLWSPNVSFTVNENSSLKIDIGLYAKRIDIDVFPMVFLRSMSLYFLNSNQFSTSADVVGSTFYSNIPNVLYVPGNIDSLSIRISTWSAFTPLLGWGRWNEEFQIRKDLTFSVTNSTRNLTLHIKFPYFSVGGLLLGFGDVVVITVLMLLLAGFIISVRRYLHDTDLRNRLTDSRTLPLLLLFASVIFPWGAQLTPTAHTGYDTISWLSWFSMPFMIRWSTTHPMQVLLSVQDWWYASLISTFLLFLPMFYGFLSLSSDEPQNFDKTFAFILFLPCLVVLSAFNYSAITLETMSLGPILAILALPVWLIRLILRRIGLVM